MEALSDKAKIYVGNLPARATDDVLSGYFSKYGRVVKATPAKGRPPGKPNDFGFVWFADEDSAKAAVGDVEEHVILGTMVEVRESKRKEPPSVQQGQPGWSNGNGRNPKKIFVGGLPPDLNQEEFKSLFERYGETTDVVLMVERFSRRPRGFGFVTFASEESAREVLRHSQYLIRGNKVDVKAAIPKEESDSSVHPGDHSLGQYYPPGAINGHSYYPNYPPAAINWHSYHPNYPPAAINGHSYHPNSWNGYSTPFPFGYPVAPVVPYVFQPWSTPGVLNPWASRDDKTIKIDFGAAKNFKKIKITEPPGGRRGSSSATGAEVPSPDPAPAECTDDVQLFTPDESNNGAGSSPPSAFVDRSPSGESNGTSASPPAEDCINDGNTS